MLKPVLHIAFPLMLITLGACSVASTVSDEADLQRADSVDIYANEYGEIHLTAINDTQTRAVFFNNQGQTFDTVMRVDYDYTIIHNDSLPFLWLKTGGIKVYENRLEVYDFAGPAYMQMYTGIPSIYEAPFYKLNDTVTIKDVFVYEKGEQTIAGIYVIPMRKTSGDFVALKGIVTKEEFPREYYSTPDGPQGMFADTSEVHYRLVIEPIDLQVVAPFVYEGRTVNLNGSAVFIWDFADSEAYYLDDHALWEEEELNQKLKISAVLVQFENGKSVLKNWKLID